MAQSMQCRIPECAIALIARSPDESPDWQLAIVNGRRLPVTVDTSPAAL